MEIKINKINVIAEESENNHKINKKKHCKHLQGVVQYKQDKK